MEDQVKKYRLTEVMNGNLHRIEALVSFNDVCKGDKGGWIEKESNLSHDGGAWVYDNAQVHGDAAVCDDARVICGAVVCENAKVCDNAVVGGYAHVSGNAWIGGTAMVNGNASILGDARVTDMSSVFGRCQVYGHANVQDEGKVFGDATVCGTASVSGAAQVYGDVCVQGDAEIGGDAVVSQDVDFLVFKNLITSGRCFTWTRSDNKWRSGDFVGNKSDLLARAYDVSDELGLEYKRLVEFVDDIMLGDDCVCEAERTQVCEDGKLRVFTAFSGYDSQCLALERIKEGHPGFDYELVGWSEIDKHAISAHNLLFPDAADKNYGDISKIDWQKVPDFDLFTYSFPCFPAGAMVHTDSGYLPIEKLSPGMRVLTHANRYQPISKCMSREYKGTMYDVRTTCCENFVCTENHPIYVRGRHKPAGGLEWYGDPEWKTPREIKEDLECNGTDLYRYYAGYAVNHESRLPEWDRDGDLGLKSKMDYKWFWYMMGLYATSGYRIEDERGRRVSIMMYSDYSGKFIQAVKHFGWKHTVTGPDTMKQYNFMSDELYDFVGRYGNRAEGLKVDNETLNLPVPLLREFLRGAMRNCVEAVLHGREFAYGMGHCVAKVYGQPFAIEKFEVNDVYSLKMMIGVHNEIDLGFYKDGCVWFAIQELHAHEEETTVYNLEVVDDESYTANGITVHNCTDISNAGLKKGFTENSGTRSSLLWECRKTIEQKLPRLLLMENVNALVNKKNLPEFQKWLDELEGFGYANFWQVMNAKDYGIPQNRKRVFCISILKNDDADTPTFKFPEPVPLERRLRDVLECNVDESYYLKQEQVDKILANCDKKLAQYCDEVGDRKTDTENRDEQALQITDAWPSEYRRCYQCVNYYRSYFCGYESSWCEKFGSLDADQERFHPDKTAQTCEAFMLHRDCFDCESCMTCPINCTRSEYAVNGLPKVSQVGNLVSDDTGCFKNPQRGRVYSIDGIAPCMDTCNGGGLEPKIVVRDEDDDDAV